MLKTIYKNLLWIALPLGLTMGCAANRPQTEAVYGPSPNETLQPTSARLEQQIYSNNGMVTEDTSTDLSAPPEGATVADWRLAEEIRQKLTYDRTLVPLGSTLIAEISKDGIVTLQGTVGTPSEQQRVCDSIASLPGVRGVNNQLNIGRENGSSTIEMH